jgi:hypothetical protein
VTKNDANTGSERSSREFSLTRDMLSTTSALLDLRDRGQAVYIKKLPYHTTACDRMVANALVTVSVRKGKKIMVITQAGRDALTKAGY